MRKLSERYCDTIQDFVDEAIRLYKWSPDYYDDWLCLQGARTGAICLCFEKASKTGNGGSKKLVKLMGFNVASAEAALASFEAAVAGLQISLQRRITIDAILVDLAENG